MALASAQLAAAITSSQLSFNLSNISSQTALPAVGGTPLSIGYPMMIDSEMMFVISQPVTGTVVVRSRGSDGSAAAAHDINANVYFSTLTSDMPTPVVGTMISIDLNQDNAVSVGQSGAIPVPTQGNQVVNINSLTAIASTLAAPPLGINAVTLVITSNTAAAHVITATGLIQDGVAGAPHTTLTFAAQKGATVKLVAENGFWNVISLQNVTVS